MAKPQEVTDDTFQQDVLESENPVLVDFWAPWCGPCRMVAPIVEELADEYDGKVNFFKLNTDENPQIASQFGIRSIPTLLVFKGGQAVGQSGVGQSGGRAGSRAGSRAVRRSGSRAVGRAVVQSVSNNPLTALLVRCVI